MLSINIQIIIMLSIDTQYIDTRLNSTQHKVMQHNDTNRNDTNRNDTLQNDTRGWVSFNAECLGVIRIVSSLIF
jgi:hypothetical protein